MICLHFQSPVCICVRKTLKEMDSKMIISKFRGTFLGCLMGDVVGCCFEGKKMDAGNKLVMRNYLDKLEGPYFRAPSQCYSDDTKMTKAITKALIKYNKETYQKELAINFVKDYFDEPKRGYGNGVIEVFRKLKQTKFEDVTKPAYELFNGSGSYGNGAAMRVSPVALFNYKNFDNLINMVRATSEITHSNVVGINGAVFQAVAVYQNLHLNPDKQLDVEEYINNLKEKLSHVEKDVDEFGIKEEKFYAKQLDEITRLLKKDYEPTKDEVVNKLGHSVSALYSVPTALYCFLRNFKPKQNTPDKDVPSIRRILEYAVSLEGDSDTIASMACALAGAYYSDKEIMEKNLFRHLEGYEAIIQLADELYSTIEKN